VHGSIPDVAAGDFDRPHFKRFLIDADRYLTPNTVFGAAIRQAHVQCFLKSAQGAEIRRGPVQSGQPQQALDEPGCLAKWHAKQDLQRQTGLRSGVAELLAPTALIAWRRFPNHLRIKPYRQRSTLLQAFIVRRPILGLVPRSGPTAHRPLLSRWIHAVNPINLFVQ
jgi:hypothetical protein